MNCLNRIKQTRDINIDWLKVLPIILLNLMLLVTLPELPLSVFTTKFFVLFLFAVLCAFISIGVLINVSSISFSKVDEMVMLLFIYLLVTNFRSPIQYIGENKKLIIFCSSVSIYFYLRIVSKMGDKVLILASVFCYASANCILVLLQKFGFYASHNINYEVTGSFFHPAPLAGYLAVTLPLCVLTCYLLGLENDKRRSLSGKIVRVISFVTLVLILIILPSLHSRAATISIIIALSTLGLLLIKETIINHIRRYKIVYISGAVLIFISLFIVFYQIRSGSIEGRLLVWKITGSIIWNKPLLGHGLDSFKKIYSNYQIDYFKMHPNSNAEILLSDEVTMAFNEILQLLSETGLIGLVLIILIVFSVLKYKWQTSASNPYSIIFNLGIKVSLLGFCVFSLFSYPFSVTELTLLFFMLLGLFDPSIKESTYSRRLIGNTKMVRFTVYIVLIVMIINTPTMISQFQGYKNWFKALNSPTLAASKNYFLVAQSNLRNNGVFLSTYGKFHFNSDSFQEAASLLEKKEGKTYEDLILLGDCYRSMAKDSLAIHNYQQAYYLLPHRFVPLGKQLDIHVHNKNEKYAGAIAAQILSKEIKVPSSEIEFIRSKAQSVIDKLEK